MNSNNFDFCVIGAGIVGLAVAESLTQRFQNSKILVLEKEPGPARHQTGRNSGVIHSGIYYSPGSLKAELCRSGKEMLVEFCRINKIRYEICGKIIVATEESEREKLLAIFDRGNKNGLKNMSLLDPQQIQEAEPYIQGLAGIHVPETGIVDYKGVCSKLVELQAIRGVRHHFGQGLIQVEKEGEHEVWSLKTPTERFHAKFLINCGGLHSDRIARLSGFELKHRIVPFRGEYYELNKEFRNRIQNLVYPVPDPRFPFLGVHFTRMFDGTVECGPNAVLAFAREGYRFSDFSAKDLFETLSYSGFQKLAQAHFVRGLGELHRSISKAAFVKALQKLMPSLQGDMLHKAEAGVRAQALDAQGKMIEDFAILSGSKSLQVINAPSPAATAALAIGQHIVSQIQ